ncbi:EAL domain-containing protein [Motilimonas cestriensis]|uniref:EAL domain-containing protein n=1 Tax=Motilimonas cestriensis TaxID=2742685 RepID=A0ABS8WGA8_9GAMM|nr:EAL domain-containing protein [Motilimonas cestriensis]MCE2596651.1 EAL domain-containing protein [Motilimonas cestriensis]
MATHSSAHHDAQLNVPPKILVVDDIPENHRAFGAVLNHLNAQIFNASSGKDAVALTLRHHFAVILLDVMMPDMDGYETAEIIRVNEDNMATPIIFITALDRSEEFEKKGYETGAVDYLFKPVSPNKLAGKISVFVELETQRIKIKQNLSVIDQLRKRNELILKSVGEGIIGLNKVGEVSFSNPAAQVMLEYSEPELEKLNFVEVACHSNTDNLLIGWEDSEIYKSCMQGNSFHAHIEVFFKKSKIPFPVEYLATPIQSANTDNVLGFVIAFMDITARQKTEEELVRLAQIDTLTGLYNRYSFSRQLSKTISNSLRQKQSIALLFIDLDRFKQINDTLGHETGDHVLKESSKRLSACLRDGDTLCRIGGDEFAVIVENISSGISVAQIADKILEELKRPFHLFGHEIHLSASIGIAVCPMSAISADPLLRCADMAMYKAKQAGKNAYQFFTDEMQNEVASELALENALRIAVKKNEFQLYFQPKVHAKTHQVLGTEALIRWASPSEGFLSPDVFIPKAEEMGLIHPIGTWVLEQGTKMLKEWQDKGYVNERHTIAINLSMRQLMHKDLIDIISNVLKKSKLAPECLELEITESIMMVNSVQTISILNAISELGVKIAIDDFGTGYSSLSYLRLLPIHTIKVDRSFVQVIGIDNGDAIVKTIISLGNNLGLTIVAEGAESPEQVTFLTENNVDLIQGFYFSKPLPLEEYIKYLKVDR